MHQSVGNLSFNLPILLLSHWILIDLNSIHGFGPQMSSRTSLFYDFLASKFYFLFVLQNLPFSLGKGIYWGHISLGNFLNLIMLLCSLLCSIWNYLFLLWSFLLFVFLHICSFILQRIWLILLSGLLLFCSVAICVRDSFDWYSVFGLVVYFISVVVC